MRILSRIKIRDSSNLSSFTFWLNKFYLNNFTRISKVPHLEFEFPGFIPNLEKYLNKIEWFLLISPLHIKPQFPPLILKSAWPWAIREGSPIRLVVKLYSSWVSLPFSLWNVLLCVFNLVWNYIVCFNFASSPYNFQGIKDRHCKNVKCKATTH